MIETPTLLERFCRYVKIDTQAQDGSPTYPSTPGQIDLAKLLLQELLELGIADVEVTEHGIVYGTIPSTVTKDVPTIALFAHMDTSPDASGKSVQPQVIQNYQGQDLVLPGNPKQILTPTINPELKQYLGKTLITTDGTTLLGADNKAGVAVIMEMAQHLMKHPEIPHGPIRICFTCDEEIGHGTDHVDLQKLGAIVGYTLDGGSAGELDEATFSADRANVTIRGINIHPSIGKGKMVNAVRLASLFIDRLPRVTMSPETTEGREGFLHPYLIEGNVAETKITFLLRDFITENLRKQESLLRAIGSTIEAEYPLAKVEIEIVTQYRNMADYMKHEPRAVAYAAEAMKRVGIEPRLLSCRGGTDGSRFTEKGLPCPNIFTAEHNQHSPLEWTCLEEMAQAVEVCVELVKRWAE
jgi:tripeptide aminopeptidase